MHVCRFRYWLSKFPAYHVRKRPNKGILGHHRHDCMLNYFSIIISTTSMMLAYGWSQTGHGDGHSKSQNVTKSAPLLLPLKRITSQPGLQKHGMAGVSFDLFSQAIHHILKHNLIAIPIPAPNRFDDISRIENMPGPTHQ